jgi:TonB family protein
MNSAVGWRTLEGSTVDGKFPLRHWLGGSDRTAVFQTERMLLGVTGGQKAAIKLFSENGADSAAQLSRWRAAAQLSHPNLVRVFDSGQCQMDGEKILYVVMEYADEDLSQILPQRPLTPGEVGDMLPPLLDALSYLHNKGFVHAHIRPSNLLAVGDQLKLSADQLVPASTAAAEQRRRDAYDAPETAAGVVLPESDMWSVGAILVTALTQNSPAEENNSQQNPAVPKSMPEPFRGIARECLYLDPKRRISVADILARLQPAARSVPAEAELLTPTPARSNRALITIAILAVAVVVGLIAFFSHGKSGSSQPSAATNQSSQSGSAPPESAASAPSTQPAQSAPSSASSRPSAASTPPIISQAPAAKSSVPPEAPRAARPAATPTGAVLHRVVPDVPKSARNTITGKIKVTVRVDVDNSGKVTATKLTQSGPSQYFARLALNAAQHWEFAPAQAGGQPASSTWQLHFRFGRKGTEVSPERVTR